MNAPDTTVVPRAATPVHPTHKFKLLLQREYWEHKGGFLWAPLIAGGISLLLTGMMIVFGLVAARRAGNGMTIDGVRARKSTRLKSSHYCAYRMPSSA